METLEQIALELIEHIEFMDYRDALDRPLLRTDIYVRFRDAVPRLPPDAYVIPWEALLEADEF
ncbi:MAG TPA: hypothetical protein VL625_02135 [Patescibacteria group bacterium]|nr:hypothetical protein [Patescibacteria group bacterium]